MVRLKHRYAAVEVAYDDQRHSDETLSSKRVVEDLRRCVHVLHGDYGLACVLRSMHVKYLNVQTRIAIVRIARDYYKVLLSSLAVLTKLNDVSCKVKVLHLGGTIRSCQRFLITHNRKVLLDCLKSAKTPVERAKLVELISSTSGGRRVQGVAPEKSP